MTFLIVRNMFTKFCAITCNKLHHILSVTFFLSKNVWEMTNESATYLLYDFHQNLTDTDVCKDVTKRKDSWISKHLLFCYIYYKSIIAYRHIVREIDICTGWHFPKIVKSGSGHHKMWISIIKLESTQKARKRLKKIF